MKRSRAAHPPFVLPRPITAEDIRQRNLDAANALTLEQRQRFLDAMWGGASIGEARERVGISFEAALGIMDMSIEKHEVYQLRREAK